jgi:hypothetical protein
MKSSLELINKRNFDEKQLEKIVMIEEAISKMEE